MHTKFLRFGNRPDLTIIAVILFVFWLTNPVQCLVDINISSRYPASFLDDENIIINYSYKYDKQLEYYIILVKEYNTNKQIHIDRILLKDKFPGENSPISKSINLGKIKAGTYVVELKSVPNETKIKGDIASDLLKVSEATGNLWTYVYNGYNNNKNKDATEGLSGIRFRIGKVGEPQLEYEEASNGSGVLFIKLGVGQYEIEQLPIGGWTVIGSASKNFDILKNQTTFLEYKNIPIKPVSRENFWRMIFLLFFVLLFLVVKYKNKIYPNKVPVVLRLVAMLILYLIIIKLIELSGFDPYENLVISIIGCIIIAPVLHKLAEIIIIDFLAKYTVGSAVVVSLNYLDITHNIETLLSVNTPLEKMNYIVYIAIGIILSIIIGYIAEKLYKYFKAKYAKSHERAADAILIIVLLLFSTIYGEPDDESFEPKIISLITDVPNLAVNSTIVLTAEVSNPSNLNILYRFYINNESRTEWIRQDQYLWTIDESDIGEAKVEVKIKGDRMAEGDTYDSKHIVANIQKIN